MKLILASSLLLIFKALSVMGAPVADPIPNSNKDLERVRYMIRTSADGSVLRICRDTSTLSQFQRMVVTDAETQETACLGVENCGVNSAIRLEYEFGVEIWWSLDHKSRSSAVKIWNQSICIGVGHQC